VRQLSVSHHQRTTFDKQQKPADVSGIPTIFNLFLQQAGTDLLKSQTSLHGTVEQAVVQLLRGSSGTPAANSYLMIARILFSICI
jgi:hypothetical protein